MSDESETTDQQCDRCGSSEDVSVAISIGREPESYLCADCMEGFE